MPPANFNPFFTLIEDSTANEHHHPYVHYVFADDDPVIVTAAAMRSLGLDDTQFLPQPEPQRHHDDGDEGIPGLEHEQDGESSEPQVESPLPPPIPGVKERYIIVDVAADGHTVLDAQSLSKEWQITAANVRSAPSFDDEGAEGHAYMLQIEGVEIPAKSKGKGKGEPGESRLKGAMEKSEGDVFRAMDALVGGIEEGLEVAGKILGVQQGVGESENTAVPEAGLTSAEG